MECNVYLFIKSYPQKLPPSLQDTAFYECRASNGRDTIKSVAIVTVRLGKVSLARPHGVGVGGNGGNDDDAGLLPETYSDPDFRGASNVEFEGDRKPTFDGAGRSGNDKLDMKHLPNLKPDERSG